jgi:flagellar hook assembly protein FlgD
VVAPVAFNPDGGAKAGHATLTFVPGESGTARVSILGGNGTVVRRLTGWLPVTAQTQSVTWDGTILSGTTLTAAPEGGYLFEVELRDLAGNSATATSDVLVDRTLGGVGVKPRTISPGSDGVKDAAKISFSLSRSADATIALQHGATVVTTIRSHTYAAGVQSVAWDGKLDSGKYAPSGNYTVTVKGSFGTTSASVPLRVDRTAPRLTVPATLTVARGAATRVRFVVRDKYSPTVSVIVTVAGPKLVTPMPLKLGWVKEGVGHVVRWKPKARGAYTLTFAAVDQGGNRRSAAAVTAVKVR